MTESQVPTGSIVLPPAGGRTYEMGAITAVAVPGPGSPAHTRSVFSFDRPTTNSVAPSAVCSC